jgi:phage terminase large subunit
LFINEANTVSFEAFDQLEVRTKEFVFLDYNPTNSFWAFSEIMDINPKTGVSFRDDWDLIILTYKDNEALSQNIVDSIEQRKNRKGWWQVYGLGQLGEVEGKIYKDWAIIDEIPHEARLERYGIDFGYSNDPTAIVAIYYLNGGYIVDEILYKKEMTNKQIADTLLNYPQALTVADSAEPKSIAELSQYGINIIGAEKGKDSVVNNIQIVQDERMSLTRNSVHIKKEYDNFLWRTDKDGKILNIPEHEFKHGMDAVAYAMASIKRPQVNTVHIHRPKYAGFRRH